jgi:hypothetical protein
MPDRDPHVLGRGELVAGLARRLVEARDQRTAAAYLSGPPGIGLTTVATEVAHLLAERQFPGGAYYVDLRGLDLDPRKRLSAQEAADRILGGVPTPAGADRPSAAALDVLAQQRVVVVLDHAKDSAHVEDLFPAPRSCALIVTSRERVHDLPGHTVPAPLPFLRREDSVAVLVRASGRRDGAPANLDRVAGLCGDTPLALRLVAAKWRDRDDLDAADLADMLQSEVTRLRHLETPKRSMWPAILLSYAGLGPPTRRVFRFAAAGPGPDVTPSEMARSLKMRVDEADLELNRLVKGWGPSRIETGLRG